MSDMSDWGFSEEEARLVVSQVRELVNHDMVVLKPIFNKLEKSVASLDKAINDFMATADELPEFYLQYRKVAIAIVLLDQAHDALGDLPEVFIEKIGERLPKKGITPKTNLVVYLTAVYEEKVGKPATISTHTYKTGHPLCGDFVDFLDAVCEKAEVNVPALARHAKEMLQAR